MAHRKNNRTRLGTTSFLTLLVYLFMKFGCTPQAPDYAPERIWMKDLHESTYLYCEKHIIFEDAVVNESQYFLERCTFTIRDTSSKGIVHAISPIFRGKGTKLSNIIFYVEPINGSGKQCNVLLRESRHK